MKKLLFILFTFLFAISYAQSTYIPDTNFEIALANLGYDDGLLNHSVPTANISGVTSLYIPLEGISDLTGIEDFTSLTFLNCASNNLSTIDISNNTALTIFSCSGNNLTSLDVSNNTALRSLTIVNNQIASIDLSTNLLLESFYASNNLLTSLDLSMQPNLVLLVCDNNLLTSLSVKNGNNTAIPNADFKTINNPNLLCIEVDNATYSTTNWTNIDVQTTFRNSCALTYVPDNNFEQELINLGYDTALDNYVYTEDINTINSLDISLKGIADITGIEDFISLTFLNCRNNNLSVVDISNNLYLEHALFYNNNLTEIDVSNNVDLYRLGIASNQIATLDLSHNFSLRYIYASNNLLTTLDLSNQIALLHLNCDTNLLTSLSVKNSNNTAILNANFSAINNPNLLCIEVDNATYSTTNWTNIDAQSIFRNNCALTYVPDNNFEQALIDLGYDTVLDDYVYTENINSIISLSIGTKGIADLTGIEDFTALQELYAPNNLLTSINISQNINLRILQLGLNQLTTLSVISNTALTELYCEANLLTGINLSNNTLLSFLNIGNNQLTTLNVSNNTALVDLQLENNFLTSINISTNTNLTSLKIGSNLVTALNTNTNVALKYLYINGNQITTLNLANNTNLRFLYCNNNLLSTLDVSNNTLLRRLYCYTNNLSVLDVSLNTVLEELNFRNNSISIIDINDCPDLKYLYANNNQLTSLDISNNSLLEIIHCHNNQLIDIDASIQSNLVEIDCNNNLLTSLNVANGNNTLMNSSSFNATLNPDLTCIQVDNIAYSYTNWTNIDATANFSINCHYFDTYVPDDNFEQALIDLGYDTVLDDYVLTANINTITSLDISAKSIADVTGLEDFTALETLICSGNSLTTIDISQNSNLLTLNCASNLLTALDTSLNLVLEMVNCANNQITSLDLSNNTLLANLNCKDNLLTNVNVFTNTNLSNLNCSNNLIGALNLITNTNLSSLDCSHNLLIGLLLTNGNNTAITDATFDATFNASLTCIEVDDEIYSTSNWTNIDYHAGFSNNCHYGETYVPDDNFEQELINLGYDTVLDDYVITANINTVGFLDVSFKSIADLTGIGDFTVLTQLLCNNNMLINLDLGNNTLLNYVNCSFNNLSDVYISSPSLNYLSASNNQLLDLDLSNKLFLTHVELQNNVLNSLNIKNGNNTIITNFNITTNPNLFCVQVDDIAYSTTNWTNKDAHTFYNTNCNYPSIWRTAHWINGAPTLTKDAIIDDNYNTGAFGSINAFQLNINTTKNVTISPNSYIRVNANLINNGDFIIEHEGSFLQLQDLATVGGSGSFVVQSKTTQLIDADRFTYFSSPTATETLNTFSSWANMNKVYSFNATLQAWNPELPSNMMQQAKGFAVKGQPDVGQYPFNGETNFNGYFNNGIIAVPMHYTAGDPLLDDDNTLIGNPYPSAVSASLLLNNNVDANAFYFWTHASLLGSGGYIADDYAIWNRSGGIASTSGSPAPTGYIASCQGFFVTSLASSTFTFDNSVRVSANNDDFRTPNDSENDKIWLDLTSSNGLFNQILLNFSTEGTVDFDATYDATRLSSGNPISFYSNGLNSEKFAIQALPNLIEETIIPLGYTVANENVTQLKISINHLENLENTTVYLKDNLLNITHQLNVNDYEFTTTEGIFTNRFELILSRDALSLETNLTNQESLMVSNISENEINIKTTNGAIISEFKAYDIVGKLILNSTPNQANLKLQTTINEGTILFITAKLIDGTILRTKFIKYL